MKRIIIAGASGMIGQLILQECLASTNIKEVVSLVRRPSKTTNEKLIEVVVKSFTDYSAIAHHFNKVDTAYFCIGAYTGQVDDAQFKAITIDYAVAFAKALKKGSLNAKLCLLSGAGADRSQKSRAKFARYKGMSETIISNLNLDFYAFRPAYIYPVNPRKEPNIMYRIMRLCYPLIKRLGANSSITSVQLAKTMFYVGLHGTEQQILENKDILELYSKYF